MTQYEYVFKYNYFMALQVYFLKDIMYIIGISISHRQLFSP